MHKVAKVVVGGSAINGATPSSFLLVIIIVITFIIKGTFVSLSSNKCKNETFIDLQLEMDLRHNIESGHTPFTDKSDLGKVYHQNINVWRMLVLPVLCLK